MFLFLLPFAALFGVVMLSRRSAVAAARPQLMLSAPSAGPTPSPIAAGAPSPIAVLCVFLRNKCEPPPIVVQCALAEAQLTGQHELAADLMRTFAAALRAPVAALGRSRLPGKASCKPPIDVHTFDQTLDQAFDMPAPDGSAIASELGLDDATMPPERAAEIDAGLAALAAIIESTNAEPAPQASESDRPPVTEHDADDADPGSPMTLPSPIAGVADESWSRFCGQLVREAPTFSSGRHVGRYRHRKDRLAELGFDPDSIVGSEDAQDAALGADLADAYRHVIASSTRHHLGRPVTLPDIDAPVRVTLSGVLGIASVAGLEGAEKWLSRKDDRKRFPHTTQAFLRTNGVF